MGDPAFLGHHLLAQAKMSVKVVEKTEPGEKVGLIAVRNDQTCCLEYSDLSSDFQNQRDPDGALSYRAGNIAVHAFDLDFAQEMAEARLPLHPARKAVSALNAAGEKVETEAVKFETFVFDALPLAENVIVQMCDRDEEFAPVKNADGEDSPTSCKEALNLRARKWLSQACPDIAIPSTQAIELAPGLSISSQDLASRAEGIRINPSGLVTLCQTDG
jgi:UDP-N-acetylglucosamine/UDP-N-acetylgalactosamine diphosphorylase